MKRSRSITLMFMAGAAITLTACGEDPETQEVGSLVRNTAECVAVAGKTAEQCEQEFKDAQKEHEKTAPKFTSKEECEKEFGPNGCTTPSNANNNNGSMNSFLPLMMGYMIGQSFNRPQPAYYGPGSYREQDRERRPIYGGSSASGAAFAPRPLGYPSSSGSVFSPSVKTGGAPSATARATTSSRGGFGSVGRAGGAVSS